jgi:hypothetical protein
MPDTERTVSDVVRRERARRRLRGATAGAGILGVAAGGLVAYYLPGPAHTSNTSSGTSSTSQHSAASDDSGNGSDDHGSGTTSNSGPLGSSSAPAASSGPAAATSGGS